MENKLQEFYKEELGKIRAIEINGVPWFVGKDVCNVFGDKNHIRSLSRIDAEDKIENEIIDSIGRSQRIIMVNESGLYALLFQMKPQKANKGGVSDAYPIKIQERIAKLKQFKRWVTSEVLPSIRKHGVYITDEVLQKILQNREYGDWLLNELQNERVKSTVMREYIGELEPKARYCDLILQCKNAVPISIIAKDYGVSAIAFNRFLNLLKVQYKLRDTWLLYQEHAGNGYTKSFTYLVNENKALVHTYWTQKGRLFIYELLKEICILPVCERSGADVTA